VPEEQTKWSELSVKKEEPFKNIKIVIGQESMNKIESMNLFIVGAGAIGCELLKNFAMVNMGSKGKITVTDPDHIENSNLSRQFLFRQKHVKKPKSATASAVLIQMNPNLKNHISARLDKVCEESEDIYSDEFFKSQSVIANALDNVRARQYMDKRCVSNKVPLFESGTLGPKGHVQVIVPYKTENYGSQADP
jgi:molybdopterin/thiamine biosynthesis adenylyltransferase